MLRHVSPTRARRSISHACSLAIVEHAIEPVSSVTSVLVISHSFRSAKLIACSHEVWRTTRRGHGSAFHEILRERSSQLNNHLMLGAAVVTAIGSL